MKIRIGFVSNSSSSSFLLIKCGISDDILDKMRNHRDAIQEYVKENKSEFNDYNGFIIFKDFGCIDESWGYTEKDGFIGFETMMNNFDLITFAERIGIPKENIIIGPEPFLDEIDFDLLYHKTNKKYRKKKLKRLLK